MGFQLKTELARYFAPPQRLFGDFNHYLGGFSEFWRIYPMGTGSRMP